MGHVSRSPLGNMTYFQAFDARISAPTGATVARTSAGGVRLTVRLRTGRSPAEDVRLAVDRPVWLWGRDDVLKLMSQLPLFAKGGFSIPPGFTLTYALQDGRVLSHVFERNVDQPTQFAITAFYRSNGGREVEETSRFSLDLLEETSAGDKDFWTRQVVQALRDLKPRDSRL